MTERGKWTIARAIHLSTGEYMLALSWDRDGRHDDVVARVCVRQVRGCAAADRLYAIRTDSDNPAAEHYAAGWLDGAGQFAALLACAEARGDAAGVAAFTYGGEL